MLPTPEYRLPRRRLENVPQDAVDKLEDALDSVGSAAEDVVAAIFISQEVFARLPDRQSRMAAGSTPHAVLRLVGRGGGLALHLLLQRLEHAIKVWGMVQDDRAEERIQLFSEIREDFVERFPNTKRLRDSIAHVEEQWPGPPGDERHALSSTANAPAGMATGEGRFRITEHISNNRYQSSWKGKFDKEATMVGWDTTMDTANFVLEVVASLWMAADPHHTNLNIMRQAAASGFYY